MTATATATRPPSRRIAVFGSVAAPDEEREAALSPAASAVLERVHEAIAANAPSIVKPILDRAVAEGAITRAERHAMLLELSGEAIVAQEPAASVSLGARGALREALAAIRGAAPGIARPILDQAVDEERLTPAQERRILERLRSSPARALRGTVGARMSRALPSA
jgi:hypothetical protein